MAIAFERMRLSLTSMLQNLVGDDLNENLNLKMSILTTVTDIYLTQPQLIARLHYRLERF